MNYVNQRLKNILVIECRLPAVYVSNAFTPNSDGLNDIWIPKYSFIQSVNLKIYNRWGQLIFVTNQFDIGWDGLLGGVQAPTGCYIYTIEYLTIKGTWGQKVGNLTLYR
jgi:gliding motility-associated-like protein